MNAMDNVSSLIDGSIAVLGAMVGVIAFIGVLMASVPPTIFNAEVEAGSGAGNIRTTLKRAA